MWQCLKCRSLNQLYCKHCVTCGAEKDIKTNKCSKCGRSIASDFCIFCGAKQTIGAAKIRSEVRKKRKKATRKKADLPEKLLRELPAELNKISEWLALLAKGQRPKELKRFGHPCDKLFEYYLYLFFVKVLHMDCKPWGQIDTLFKSFCDGYFIIPRKRELCCLYDAKAYSKGYNTSIEIPKLTDYVKKHKDDMGFYANSQIAYFLIVSSAFKGDFNKQRAEFHERSQVNLALCKVEDLVYFSREATAMSEVPGFFNTIKWEHMLSSAKPILTKEIFDEELGRLGTIASKFSLMKD